MGSIVVSDQEQRAIEQLLYAEASCLDRSDLDQWITLYTDDGTYWMPASHDQPDPLNHISLFYDDRVLMEVRRRNMRHPKAASKEHTVRCSHLIGNIQVTGRDAATGGFTVTSNFHCLMYYCEEQTLFGGTYKHELVRVDDTLKIHHKRVDLINCDAAHGSIIVYL